MVWPPFSLITASMHLGILSMRFWHTSDAILFHSSTNLSHNSCTSLGGLLYMQSCCLRCSQRCSMGLRSRDCAGHDRTLISLSSNHSVAFWDMCLGSLSCWKYRSPSSISNFSKFYTTPSLKIWQYWSVFIFPSTFISTPTPFQPIHPHTMRLFNPPCFIVGHVVQSEMDSPFVSIHTPSNLIQSCLS